MNQKLQNILDIIQKSEKLDVEQKENLLKAVKDADKELEMTVFKLDRTEKVKKTTAILLEETIEELEQKRKAVEDHNRELEIQAALERVRAVAMSMHKSDDLLNVSTKLFAELKTLGFKDLRNSLINIFNDEMRTFVNYDYSDFLGGSISNISYDSHPSVEEYVIQIRNATDAFVETVIDKNQLDEWKEFRRSHGEQDDPRLENINALYYHHYSIGSGSIGISNLSPITEEQRIILKRFRNVFNLSYQRYMDIFQAEAQAREAQIEASLERVRAVAMAMHKPEDLLNVSKIHFVEFKKLGFSEIRNAGIAIFKDEESYFLDHDYSDEMGGSINRVPYNSHPLIEKLLTESRKANDAFVELVIDKDQLDSWKEFRRSHGEEDDPRLSNIDALYYYNYSIGFGVVAISTAKPIGEEYLKVLKRFRNVFDLAYRRYIDIAQAEAQARESQIQLALERVRARTMAMHKSEELSEASFMLFEQFAGLGIVPNRFFIGTVDEKEAIFDVWIIEWGGTMSRQNFKTNIEEPLQWNKVYKAWKAQDESLIVDLNSEDLIKWNNYLETIGLSVNNRKSAIRIVNTFAIFSKGFIAITTPEIVAAETVKLLERFAKVFQQTYTRFLDLQKAETQAHEAQIEASLERVRARTMAMHQSNELAETASVLFNQMISLGVHPKRCVISIINQTTDKANFWLTTSEGKVIPAAELVPLTEEKHLIEVFHAWKKKEAHFTFKISGKDRMIWTKYIMEKVKMHLPEYQPDKINQDQILKEPAHFNCFFFTHGFLMLHTAEKLQEKDIPMMKRFAGVFEQSYRRFLDLKNAEAQAREAQIEASLERVRAKTMSMHRSDELADSAAVVFQQLINLGIEPNRIYIAIMKDDKGNVEFWITDEDGSKVSSGFQANLNNNRSFMKMLEGWKNKDKSKTIDMQGDELQEYFNHLTKLGVPFKGGLSQKRRLQYIAYFSKGFLGVASPDETKPETLQLLERFAAVFNLTYTRFNDLLQSEAQNKIIQAENERKTKELEEARQLQLSMLPKELPKLPNLQIAVYMKTATEVGGDYYDFNVDANGTLTVAIGDATGHGMKAGTIVSMVKALFASGGSSMELKSFFNQSSAALKGIELGRLMMAFIMLKIKSSKIEFANAGMPPLFIYRKLTKTVEEVMINGMPLGAMKNFPYEIKELEITSGDTLLLLSDGLPELKNKNEEQYGYARVKEEFKSSAEKDPNEVVNHLKTSATQWANEVEPDDDVTFVVIKVK